MQTCFEIGQEKNILGQNNRRRGGGGWFAESPDRLRANSFYTLHISPTQM